MIKISHRGNLIGKFPSYENEPMYVSQAIKSGFHVEIDVWKRDGILFLGHDNPLYGIDMRWLEENKEVLWIQCKNVDAVCHFHQSTDYHFFWHQTDVVTLTSKGHIWAFPGNQPIKNSIAVLPEIYKDDVSSCVGICSDYIKMY